LGKYNIRPLGLRDIERRVKTQVQNPSYNVTDNHRNFPTKRPIKVEALLGEISVMLEKGTIERVSQPGPGFYSHIFIRTKKSGGLRPIIDLKALNKHLSVPHFKMETAQSIRQQISPLDWVVTLDMKDAYFITPYKKTSRNT
jgi:hypothetical protein